MAAGPIRAGGRLRHDHGSNFKAMALESLMLIVSTASRYRLITKHIMAVVTNIIPAVMAFPRPNPGNAISKKDDHEHMTTICIR
ncbi:hypothetical protein MishRS11D_05690 [Methylomagnum ishizawai]|nr:hypothetical protein MishRS11D_05690 [Methylomagnum ishizawai]